MSSQKQQTRSQSSKLLRIVLAFLIIAPLVTIGLVVAGVLMVTPVRQVGSMPTPVVVVGGPDGLATQIEEAPPSTLTGSGSGSASISKEPTSSSTGTEEAKEVARSVVAPDDDRIVFAAFGVAGLALLVGAAIFGLITRRWDSRDTRTGRKALRVRYAIIALALWMVFGVFLLFDQMYGVSIYSRVLVVYAGFIVLLAMVMLLGRPKREKALALGLALLFVFSVPFATWNSRKAFLRSLYSVRQGMTSDQVDAIMSKYMPGDVGPTVAEGETLKSYRHTTEGWGNSDFGVVTFRNGRVVAVSFLPD